MRSHIHSTIKFILPGHRSIVPIAGMNTIFLPIGIIPLLLELPIGMKHFGKPILLTLNTRQICQGVAQAAELDVDAMSK